MPRTPDELYNDLLSLGIKESLLKEAIYNHGADPQVLWDKLNGPLFSWPRQEIVHLWQLCLLSGDVSGYLNDMTPYELSQKDSKNYSPALYIAFSGNIEALKGMMKNKKFEQYKADTNIPLVVAWSGNVDALKYVMEDKAFEVLREKKDSYGRNIAHLVASSENAEALNVILSSMKKPSIELNSKYEDRRAMQTLDKALDTNQWLTEIALPKNIDVKLNASIQKKLLRNKARFDELLKAADIKNSPEFTKFVNESDATTLSQFATAKHEDGSNGMFRVGMNQDSETFTTFINKIDAATLKRAVRNRVMGMNTPLIVVTAKQNGPAFMAFIKKLDDATLNQMVRDPNNYRQNALMIASSCKEDSVIFLSFINRLTPETINRIVLNKNSFGRNALSYAMQHQSPEAFQALVAKMSSETIYLSCQDKPDMANLSADPARINAIFLTLTQINAWLAHHDKPDALEHWSRLYEALKNNNQPEIDAQMSKIKKMKGSEGYYLHLAQSLIKTPFIHQPEIYTSAIAGYETYLSKLPSVETKALEIEVSLERQITKLDAGLVESKKKNGLMQRLFYKNKIMQAEATERVAKAALAFIQAVPSGQKDVIRSTLAAFNQALTSNSQWSKTTDNFTQDLVEKAQRLSRDPSLSFLRESVPQQATVKPISTNPAHKEIPIVEPVKKASIITNSKARDLLKALKQQQEKLDEGIAKSNEHGKFLKRIYYQDQADLKNEKRGIVKLAHELITHLFSTDPDDIAKCNGPNGLIELFTKAVTDNQRWKKGLISQRTNELVSQTQQLIASLESKEYKPGVVEEPAMGVVVKHTAKDIEQLVLKARMQYPDSVKLVNPKQPMDIQMQAWKAIVQERKNPKQRGEPKVLTDDMSKIPDLPELNLPNKPVNAAEEPQENREEQSKPAVSG